MEQICDGSTLETLGWHLSDEEAESMVFAARIYVQNIMNGHMSLDDVDPMTAHDGVDAVIQFAQELQDGLRVISQAHKEVAESTFLAQLSRLREGIDTTQMLVGVTNTLNVEIGEFCLQSMRARAMLEQQDHGVVLTNLFTE